MLLCLFEKWKWKMLPSVRSPCWCPVEPCRRCLVQASCIIQICKQTWKQRKRMRRHLIQTLIQAKFWNFAKMKRWHIYLFLSRLLWSLSRMPSGMPPMMFTTSSSFTGISRQLLVEKDDNQIGIFHGTVQTVQNHCQNMNHMTQKIFSFQNWKDWDWNRFGLAQSEVQRQESQLLLIFFFGFCDSVWLIPERDYLNKRSA